ncbi:MAG TPA: hypothetical protein VK604_00975 [Bryobacteraceae bacterium]|nr:hypothetical protein [Bryobacteraceae bacterium]
MLPLTLLAVQKLFDLLTDDNSLMAAIDLLAAETGIAVPPITSNQVVLNSAGNETADKEILLSYPRICLYSSQIRNAQRERFRSFSGSIAVVAEVWASGSLVGDADRWIHFYVEGLTSILRANIGDWGDGFSFSGIYDVQLQPPKGGGFGYVELAKLTCNLDVSLV